MSEIRRERAGSGRNGELVLFVFLVFWPCQMACGISVPLPGIELVPPALGLRSFNHWTAREVPGVSV